VGIIVLAIAVGFSAAARPVVLAAYLKSTAFCGMSCDWRASTLVKDHGRLVQR
jgi:hypothetical protein